VLQINRIPGKRRDAILDLHPPEFCGNKGQLASRSGGEVSENSER